MMFYQANKFITFKVQEKDKGIQGVYENVLDINSVCYKMEHTAEGREKYQKVTDAYTTSIDYDSKNHLIV